MDAALFAQMISDKQIIDLKKNPNNKPHQQHKQKTKNQRTALRSSGYGKRNCFHVQY